MRLAVIFKQNHPADLDALIARQTDPASPLYGHFVSAQQFRASYAPTAQQYATTVATLQHDGFIIERSYESRMIVDVSASQATVEKTFAVHLLPSGAASAGHPIADRAVTIGASLSSVAAVVGIEPDAFDAPLTRSRATPATVVKAQSSPVVGPDNGFGPVAVTHGYDYPLQHGFNGSGTTIADVIDGAPDVGVATFLKYFNITAAFPTPTIITVNGAGSDTISADAEIEWFYATAPGAKMIEYQVPLLTNMNLVDAFVRVVSDNAADVVNISFAACETNTTFAYAVLPIIKQGAAQGMAFESVAFGGVNRCGLPGIALTQIPADSADGLAVGGANVIEDATNAIVAWSGDAASGGGISLLVPVPAVQQGVRGVNPLGRNVPDLAMSALINGTGASFNVYGRWLGGGDFIENAAVAGMLAEFTQMTHHRLGAFDRTLYTLFSKTGYGAVFRDITAGCNGILNNVPVCATTYYDITSGLGWVDAYLLGTSLP